jgi:putative ABC transport system ATP-binding protein
VLLSAEELTYTAHPDTGPLIVLDAISLDLAAGEIVDVRGASGAGKTTLLRALAWLLPHASGMLSLSGRLATEMEPTQWRRHVTLLPQVTSLFAGSVRDNLLIPWNLKVRAHDSVPSDSALARSMAEVGLAEVALDRDASQLSVGQAARVALLRVVLTGPEVLLLDEPDANLDDDSAAQVAALIERFASAGGAVLRVRHQRDDDSATRTLQLQDGRLTEVGP